MSAFNEVQTEFRDGDTLIDALKAMGFTPTNCIGNPQPLVGYQGDFRTADGEGHTRDANLALKADVIIPRSQVGGSSNDIGFARGTDGKYKAVISQYDSRRYDGKWLNDVKANVADIGVQKQAKRIGLKLGKREVKNGQITYQFIRS